MDSPLGCYLERLNKDFNSLRLFFGGRLCRAELTLRHAGSRGCRPSLRITHTCVFGAVTAITLWATWGQDEGLLSFSQLAERTPLQALDLVLFSRGTNLVQTHFHFPLGQSAWSNPDIINRLGERWAIHPLAKIEWTAPEAASWLQLGWCSSDRKWPEENILCPTPWTSVLCQLSQRLLTEGRLYSPPFTLRNCISYLCCVKKLLQSLVI